MQTMLGQLPFNISLLTLNAENLRGMRPVKVLDIFERGNNKTFHPDGLFSIETFGKVGDERRNRLFSYIPLNVPVFHPLVFKIIVELRELYGKIMAGTAYAIFNPKTNDFEESTVVDGQTGFQFFVEHFPKLQFEQRKSTSREFAIKMIEKYRDVAMMSNLIVIPAGLRDFVIQPNGKPEEDEINNLYRRVMHAASLMANTNTRDALTHLDNTRYSLQQAVNAIYTYIVSLLQGKHKLIQSWWTSRDTFHSTRNVITSNVPKSKQLGDPVTVKPTDTVVGLYQSMRGIFPLAVNLLRERLSTIFTGPNTPAYLTNTKTLKKETVTINPEDYDDWMTQEGIESNFGRFEIEGLRHDTVVIQQHYLGLIFNDGRYVRFLQDIDDVPEGFDRKHVRPITFAELYYLAIFERIRQLPVLVTRYPVIGFGGIYPSWVYLKTTTRSQCLEVLDESWQPTSVYANEWPIAGLPFVNSMSPSIVHLGRLGADHDGDMCSLTFVMTDDGIEEIRKLLNSREYYVGIDGSSTFSASNDVSELVFAELSN